MRMLTRMESLDLQSNTREMMHIDGCQASKRGEVSENSFSSKHGTLNAAAPGIFVAIARS